MRPDKTAALRTSEGVIIMSESVTKSVICPKCRQQSSTNILISANTTEDADIRKNVLDESVFRWKCAKCGFNTRFQHPFLYNDIENNFMIYFIPQVERQAGTNHTGESFAYRNVQLYDKTKDLSLVPFRDLVPGVGGVGYYFSSKQDIAFTGTVANVVERLNANLEAFFGEGVWNVRIAENIPESYEVTVAKDFSVSGMCIDVLNAIYETWHELGWAYVIENGVDTIVIGYPNIAPATSGISKIVILKRWCYL